MRLHLTIIATVFLTIASAKDPYPRNEALDVQHYTFRLELNDSTNVIAGEAHITILFKKAISSFALDLLGKGSKNFGMTVTVVQSGDKDIPFTHEQGRLTLSLAAPIPAGEERTFVVRYTGIPEDGMIISNSKFGDRTFFADNWPDRGHQWIPCIDHPSDKATVDFVIIAPDKYQVVATGRKQEETNLPRGQRLTRYTERIPVAVKVMAVGVARFAVEETAVIDNIPQSTWVYPQNRDAGFHDFAVGTKIFEYFQRGIGPYAYEKMAHVQSRTRWGGLENASNIFYTESSVTGNNKHEGLIAHEMAHQWFGNAVTEDDWHHVWLSEGFATYFASLYAEHAYGAERLVKEMNADRDQIIEYYLVNKRPIVDTTIVKIGEVLSTNTYQKAGWVLHMLRNRIGDDAFWKGTRMYYLTFKNKNVLTSDFRKIMEEASGTDLKSFFQQWLYRPGHPELTVTWTYSKGVVTVNVRQNQAVPFTFPLDIRLNLPDGTLIEKSMLVTGALERFTIPSGAKPAELVLDPFCRLLFEGTVQGK